MLKNYLKITLAVLKRRKFFTFISLFGISFTLVVLIVVTAFLDHILAPGYPENKGDRILYVSRLTLKDTKKGYTTGSNVSYKFIRNYVEKLSNVEKIGIATEISSINTYINHNKIKLFIGYTDANFWYINDFEFLEGKNYTEQNIKNNDYVAVINDDTRDKYFGKGVSAVGKMMEVDNINYRIIGVTKGCPIFRRFTSADIFLPYNTIKSDYTKAPMQGGFAALILANNTQDLQRIKDEFQAIVNKIPKALMRQSDYQPNQIKCYADTFTGSLLYNIKQIFGIDGDGDGSIWYFYLVLFVFSLIFMSLPAINLVNINLSRIMERASEIGIRKAFGASSNTLTTQFVVENVFLTLLGGIISIFLSWAVIAYLNQSGFIPYLALTINWKVFIIAIAISVVFGLLSGVYPAWRMSKLQVVEALKQ